MLTKTKIAGLIVALMALTAPMVYADNGDRHHGQMEHMMTQVLNLSDDQVKQLKDNHQKQKDAMKSIFEQMKSSREAFDAEIVKAAPDMNKINAIQTQIKTLQGQMADNHLNMLLEIKKIMTPEQFAGYMALKKERELMMRDGHGHKHWGDKQDEGDRD